MSKRDDIIETLSRQQGLSDIELTKIIMGIGAKQQPINTICRSLEKQGIIKRTSKSDGIIKNYLVAEGNFPEPSETTTSILSGDISEKDPRNNAEEVNNMVSRNIDLKALIDHFFVKVRINNIEIYNEFSLQHELGAYLSNMLPSYKVQFERNVSYFFNQKHTVKKEIDIVVISKDGKEKYAVELKCPLNGQYPEQMYAFVRDLKFMEELKYLGFSGTYSLVLVSDRPFYQGANITSIYKYFREEFRLHGKINKPTGETKKDECIELIGDYRFEWKSLDGNRKYYIIEV